MNGQDFRAYDWDDAALIKAYNIGFEARQANKKENKNGSKNKDNKRRKWHIGDYCKALYSDGLYYEAKIVSLNGDFCTVEFLGYEETEDVDLLLLKESEGKKARRRQIKACVDDETVDGSSSIVESEAAGNTTDATVVSHRHSYKKKNSHVIDTTTYEAAYHQQHSAAAPAPPVPYYSPPMPTANLPFMPPPVPVPQFSAPIPPPMPQCPSVANNPAFTSMLTSWYMAGYYTGINSVQKENRRCQRCCNHSNQCCRN